MGELSSDHLRLAGVEIAGVEEEVPTFHFVIADDDGRISCRQRSREACG